MFSRNLSECESGRQGKIKTIMTFLNLTQPPRPVERGWALFCTLESERQKVPEPQKMP